MGAGSGKWDVGTWGGGASCIQKDSSRGFIPLIHETLGTGNISLNLCSEVKEGGWTVSDAAGRIILMTRRRGWCGIHRFKWGIICAHIYIPFIITFSPPRLKAQRNKIFIKV